MVENAPILSPYTATDFVVVGDSISENGDRLTTFLVAMPPHTHDTVLQLPNCNVTPCYRGWSAQMIANSCGDVDAPLELAERLTPFGVTVVKGAYESMRATARNAIEELMNVDADFPVSMLNGIALPVSMQVYLISAVDWFEARILLSQSNDPALQALDDSIRTHLDTQEPVIMQAGEWHLPFVTTAIMGEIVDRAFKTTSTDEEREELCLDLVMRVSAARCSRGGPIDIDGKETRLEDEIALYNALDADWTHCQSALGHLAFPDLVEKSINGLDSYRTNYLHGPLRGWVSARRSAFLGAIEGGRGEEPAEKAVTLTLIDGGLNG